MHTHINTHTHTRGRATFVTLIRPSNFYGQKIRDETSRPSSSCSIPSAVDNAHIVSTLHTCLYLHKYERGRHSTRGRRVPKYNTILNTITRFIPPLCGIVSRDQRTRRGTVCGCELANFLYYPYDDLTYSVDIFFFWHMYWNASTFAPQILTEDNPSLGLGHRFNPFKAIYLFTELFISSATAWQSSILSGYSGVTIPWLITTRRSYVFVGYWLGSWKSIVDKRKS